MRIECNESVVVNNIIGSFIKQQPTIENLGRELYTATLICMQKLLLEVN